MKFILSHKIALSPTRVQESLLAQAVGVRRFAWNWALAEWNRQYLAGGKPNEALLRKQLNAVKHSLYPWMNDVSSYAAANAIIQLGDSFKRFFHGLAKHPKFKKKGHRDSARLDDGHSERFKSHGKRIYLPKIGWVKMRESLRFSGRVIAVTVSRVAGKWFVALSVEIEHTLPERKPNSVGIDLGVSTTATLSTGEKFNGPNPLRKALTQLQRMDQHLSRKQHGSKNYSKCAAKRAHLHAKITNIRRDWIHKFTTGMVHHFGLIGIENLNVSSMLASHRLARAITDVSFYEIRRQLDYKSRLNNCELVAINRWFPSSKTCSECGHILNSLPLSARQWNCPICGAEHDRDINAARNIQSEALVASASGVENACGVSGTDVALAT
jgi:putative transposase